MVTERNEQDKRVVMPRTVKFFGASVGGPPHGIPVSYDVSEQLVDINQLGFLPTAGRDSRYMGTNTRKVLFTIVDNPGPEVCFRLCRVDRDNLPQTEKGGNIGELPVDEETGINEATYGIVLAPGLIGVVSAKGGPSMSRLARYLSSKGTNVPNRLTIGPLVHKDIVSKLRNLEAISLFHFKLHPSQLPLVRGRWDELDANFDSQLAIWGEQSSLETIVAPTNESRRRARETFLRPVVSLAEAAELLDRRQSKFLVKGQPSGRISDVILNVLSETLSVEQQVEKSVNRSSGLDVESAYNAIRLGYNELMNDIQDALEIT